MSNLNDLSQDELAIIDAFRNGDRLTRARILLATMPREGDPPSPDEIQRLEFFGAYLDCNETGRTHIRTAMELLSSGKASEEVDEYLASVEAVSPKAEVIDLFRRLPV